MALLPRNPRTGGLLGAFANPLTMGGLGMLMQGPSLTPQSPFAGFGQGAMMGMGMQQQMRQAEMDRQKMELAQQKADAEQAERDRMRAAIEAMPPGLQGLAAVDPGQAAQAWRAQIEGPEPPDAPTSYDEYERAVSNGYDGSYVDFLTNVKRRPADTTTVNVNPLSPYVEDPTTPGGLKPRPGGPADPERRTAKQVAEETAKIEAQARLSSLLDEYEDMADWRGLYGVDADNAARLRREIAKARARALEPTGKLTDADIALQMEDIPDVGGAYDAAKAREALDQVRTNSGLPKRGERPPDKRPPVKRISNEVGVGPPAIPEPMPSTALPPAQPLPPGFVPD